MKKFLALLGVLLVLTMSVSADFVGVTDEKVYSVGSDIGALGDISDKTFSLDEILSAFPESSADADVVDVEQPVLSDVSLLSLPPVKPSDTTGLKSALLSVLGNYDPVVVVYQYQSSSSGYYSYATDIQPDYAWLCSAAFLALVVWCLFRLGGALIRD